MAFNETGHFKNVANLNLLIGYAFAYGATYAPAKTALQLPSLQTLYNDASLKVSAVQVAKNNYSLFVDARELAYLDIKKKATRIIGTLSGTNVSSQTITDAKTINAKIQASRAKKPSDNSDNPETIDPTGPKHSNSRQSYDSLYENFNDLVNLLTIAQNYDPNEVEFQVITLTQYAENLKKANENINEAIVDVTNKRIDRNKYLYDPNTGLVNTALEVKKYIKGIFGASSPEYKIINAISFKNKK